MNDIVRPTWDEIYMAETELLRLRSTCLRRKVGAKIVDGDFRHVSEGYNGAPKDMPHCSTRGCQRERLGIPSGQRQEICWAVHAEANAIEWARTTDVSSCTLYVSCTPCSFCARLIVASPLDIRRIVYGEGYPDEFASEILACAGVELVQFDGRSIYELLTLA